MSKEFIQIETDVLVVGGGVAGSRAESGDL